MLGFPPAPTAGPIAKAGDLCACPGCDATRQAPPSAARDDVRDAAQRIEQAMVHESQARDLELKVNDLLADRKDHVQAAAALREEAALILAGKL